jgi:hypothetical protein
MLFVCCLLFVVLGILNLSVTCDNLIENRLKQTVWNNCVDIFREPKTIEQI